MRSSRRSAAAGWCDVYRALDTRLNRPVAITVLDNGQRFLFNARYENAEPRLINIIFNWLAGIKQ